MDSSQQGIARCAQPAPFGLPSPLASVSDALAHLRSLTQGPPCKPRLCEGTGLPTPTPVELPPALSDAAQCSTAQQASTPDVTSFHMRPRRSVISHQAVKQVQHALHTLHQSPSADSQQLPAPPVLAFLNHHVLPVLAHIAIAQHHAMLHFTERLRNVRLRNPFRRHRDQQHDGSTRQGSQRLARQMQRQIEHARSLERALDPLGAAEAFQVALAEGGKNAEWLTLAAKQWSDASYLTNLDSATATQYNQQAIDLANQAIELAPGAAHGYIARCVSRGRLALLCDNKTKVQLARDACDDAKIALDLEPHNDLAHHLMGRWHYEMSGINAIARTLVRLLYGTALMCGSYEAAAEHYAKASELNPGALVHKAELGRTLHKLGKHDRARTELEASLKLDVIDLNAHLTKIEVEKLLEAMDKDKKISFWIPTAPEQPR